MDKLYLLICRLSRLFTAVVSAGLIVCVLALCAEIVLRKLFTLSLPGVHEFSEYFLAILCSFGISQALLQQAHIRIDILYRKSPAVLARLLDMLALLSMAAAAVILSYFAYPVLAKSLANHAAANTPLATPLWIPQAVWFAGLLWFAFTAVFLCVYGAVLLLQKDHGAFDAMAGLQAEGEDSPC